VGGGFGGVRLVVVVRVWVVDLVEMGFWGGHGVEEDAEVVCW
jgi:hypothetical protein